MSTRQHKKKDKANRKRKRVGSSKELLKRKGKYEEKEEEEEDVDMVREMEEKDQETRRKIKKIETMSPTNHKEGQPPGNKDSIQLNQDGHVVYLDLNTSGGYPSDDTDSETTSLADPFDGTPFVGYFVNMILTQKNSQKQIGDTVQEHVYKREQLLTRYGAESSTTHMTALTQLKLPKYFIDKKYYERNMAMLAKMDMTVDKPKEMHALNDTLQHAYKHTTFREWKKSKNKKYNGNYEANMKPPHPLQEDEGKPLSDALVCFSKCFFFELGYIFTEIKHLEDLQEDDTMVTMLHHYRRQVLKEALPDSLSVDRVDSWYAHLSLEQFKANVNEVYARLNYLYEKSLIKKEKRYLNNVKQLNYLKKDIKLMSYIIGVFDTKMPHVSDKNHAEFISHNIPGLSKTNVLNFIKKVTKSERKALRYIYQKYLHNSSKEPKQALFQYMKRTKTIDNSFLEDPTKTTEKEEIIVEDEDDDVVVVEDNPVETMDEATYYQKVLKQQGARYFLPASVKEDTNMDALRARAAARLHQTSSVDANKHICFLCGDIKHHPMQCPSTPCTVCLQPGHRPTACPHLDDPRCDWCSFRGHQEDDCVMKLYNMTSPPSEPFHLFPKPYAIPSSCYNCGSSHHTGFQCPRKPFQQRLQEMDPIHFVKDVREFRY